MLKWRRHNFKKKISNGEEIKVISIDSDTVKFKIIPEESQYQIPLYELEINIIKDSLKEQYYKGFKFKCNNEDGVKFIPFGGLRNNYSEEIINIEKNKIVEVTDTDNSYITLKIEGISKNYNLSLTDFQELVDNGLELEEVVTGFEGGSRRKTRKRKFNKKKSKRNRKNKNRNKKTKNRNRKNKNRKYSKKRN